MLEVQDLTKYLCCSAHCRCINVDSTAVSAGVSSSGFLEVTREP